MKKMFSLTVLVVLLLALVPVPASAQEGVECAEEVVVQKDDWLSKYGDKFFGNVLSWPAIMAWNNQAAAAEPDKYDWIENPDLIEVGWSICIPSAEDAEAFLATYDPSKTELLYPGREVVVATPEPAPERPTEITIVDTNSSANFQWYWQQQVIPAIADQLGVKVDYVVSNEAELLERMKAWEAGRGDAHLLFVKPESIPKALGEGIELETLYPDKMDVIPNIEKCPKAYLETVLGTSIDGKGALYWRSQYALIYNSEYIKDAPTSWKEFYDRREEWKDHIGIVRPDAKSGSSYRIPYSFLNAFVDMVDADGKAIPLAELQETDEWKDAWVKLQDFYTYAKQPLPAEPPNMFEDFNAGDTWISFYAMDYSLWSRHQGTMPPTIKSSFLAEGMAAGSDGYLVVPAGIPEEYKPVVYEVINFLISDDQQIRLITTMWQYTGTDIWDKIPGVVWDTIPAWEDMEPARLRIGNSEVKDYIKEFGADELVP